MGRREQKGGQEVETRETEEMKGGVKDDVFNGSSWVAAEGMASLAFQSKKHLVCCAYKCCCLPVCAEPSTYRAWHVVREDAKYYTKATVFVPIMPAHTRWLK